MSRTRLRYLTLLGVIALAPACRPARPTAESHVIDTEYVQALGCINSFLGCWQSRDGKRGYVFLSEKLKESRPKADWLQAICGCSNPHHAAYEVGRWWKVGERRYRFEAWLYTHYTGEPRREFKRGAPHMFECERAGESGAYYRITRVPEVALFGRQGERRAQTQRNRTAPLPEDVDWHARIVGPTNVGMKTQANDIIRVLENRLREVIGRFDTKLDKKARAKLAASQEAWKAFAKKRAEFLADAFRGGTHQTLEASLVYMDALVERIRQVKRTREGYGPK